MVAEAKIKQLEKRVSPALEEKYRAKFDRQSRYLRNGIYMWAGQYSTNTRELFLLGILACEGRLKPEEKNPGDE